MKLKKILRINFFTTMSLLALSFVIVLLLWLLPAHKNSSIRQVSALQTLSVPAATSESVSSYPAIDPSWFDLQRGSNLHFSHQLLAGSNETRAPVRILFYGQSITEQEWWKQVVDYLHVTYPKAVLRIENRAIGGHSAERLVKTAEADLYPFQPDLVIFHVYGSHKIYESIIRSIRSQTTADILMATDHVTSDQELDEETNPTRLWLRSWLYRLSFFASNQEKLDNWKAWINYDFLPTIAKKYGVELVDVRSEWKVYLKKNHLTASQLLVDNIHLNAHGKFLMAEIVKSYLKANIASSSTFQDDRLVELKPTKLYMDHTGQLRIPFNGSRIDAVLHDGDGKLLPVQVDGQPPCQLADAYRFNRVSTYPGSNWPVLLRVQKGISPLVNEIWSVRVFDANVDLNYFHFELAGSTSGSDGIGISTKRFLSNSGKVVIDPDDWNLAYAKAVLKNSLPMNFNAKWKAECLGIDNLQFPNGMQEGPKEITIVQGLSNGKHVLQLPGDALKSIEKLRIYRPLMARMD